MEKSFLALRDAGARNAYVESELINGLAHQIRIVRQQRGWSQKQLAEKLGTTQTTISRLEDPSYGKYSIRTLLALSHVFEVALFVRYQPFSKFMPATWDTRRENFEAAGYSEELPNIQFYAESSGGVYGVTLLGDQKSTIQEPYEIKESPDYDYFVKSLANWSPRESLTYKHVLQYIQTGDHDDTAE